MSHLDFADCKPASHAAGVELGPFCLCALECTLRAQLCQRWRNESHRSSSVKLQMAGRASITEARLRVAGNGT